MKAFERWLVGSIPLPCVSLGCGAHRHIDKHSEKVYRREAKQENVQLAENLSSQRI